MTEQLTENRGINIILQQYFHSHRLKEQLTENREIILYYNNTFIVIEDNN